jgi:hypothetical protein
MLTPRTSNACTSTVVVRWDLACGLPNKIEAIQNEYVRWATGSLKKPLVVPAHFLMHTWISNSRLTHLTIAILSNNVMNFLVMCASKWFCWFFSNFSLTLFSQLPAVSQPSTPWEDCLNHGQVCCRLLRSLQAMQLTKLLSHLYICWRFIATWSCGFCIGYFHHLC